MRPREHPISFNGPMVRAILEGRKTQTRRVVKPQPDKFSWIEGNDDEVWQVGYDVPEYGFNEGLSGVQQEYYNITCPYGRPGDRLWVRETWARCQSILNIKKPGRRASRLTLEVESIRVERLQNISYDDMICEGSEYCDNPDHGFISSMSWNDIGRIGCPVCGHNPFGFAQDAFKRLWDSIYAKRGFGWDANPWVWVVNFRRSC